MTFARVDGSDLDPHSLTPSPFLFFPDFTPDDPVIRDRVERCGTLPSTASAAVFDEDVMEAA